MKKIRTAAAIVLFIPLWLTKAVQADNHAEVIHWWVSGGEAAAMQVIIDKFEAQGNHWVDTPVKASYQAKSVAISRMLDGTPPTMVQWHAGIALKELYDEGLIRDLTPLMESSGAREKIPPVLLDQISVDGKIVAVPMTLHSSNWLWASKKVFNESGVAAPKSWEEFLEVAPLLQQKGYIPLALGGQPWQLRILFNNVLLSVGGVELYKEVMINHNPEAIDSEATAGVFRIFGKLKKFIDADSPDRSWSDTTRLVIEGKAAMQIMGDWAKGEFAQAGQSPGDDFLCEPSPGTDQKYLIVSDVFVAPVAKRPQDLAIQDQMARLMMAPDTLEKFNITKGSIPTRTDIPNGAFDACSQKAMGEIAAGATIIPGFNMTNKGLISNLLMDSISSFWLNEEISAEKAVSDLAGAIRKAAQ